MKNLLLVACLISLTFAYTIDTAVECQCSDVSDQTTCTTFGCKWDGSCMDKACADYTTESTCDSSDECSWTAAGACATFTACADYKVAAAATCYSKGNDVSKKYCEPNTTAGTDGKFTCKDLATTTTTPTYVTCSTLAAATCSGYESAEKRCYWKAGDTTPACVALQITACADASKFSASVCGSSCTWVESTKTCQNEACGDFTTDGSCIHASTGYKSATATLCAWDGSKCADAADTSKLTAATCMTYTAGTHLWNSGSSTCDECTGYSGVLAFTVGLMILIA